SALGIVERGEARRERESLQRGPARRAVEERAVLQPEEQADAARGRLRSELASEGGLLVDELEDLAEQLRARVALRETERDVATGATVDLGHPVHLGAGAFVLRARTLEARCNLVDTLAATTEHVADGEQLALVGPGSGYRTAVGNSVQQRA